MSRVRLPIGRVWPGEGHKTPVFVLGCNRSGKTTLSNVLWHSGECLIYRGGNRVAFDDNFRLRSSGTVRRLVRWSMRRFVIFEPANDLQRAIELLNLHPLARAIWIYRQYRDVAAAAVRDWGDAQKQILCGIARGRQRHPGQDAIREGMSPALLDLCGRLCTEEMSPEDGSALLWHVRNAIYFELELYANDRVLLVRYEDLVTRPLAHFPMVFSFLGCHFSEEYVSAVNPFAVGTGDGVFVSREIEDLCEDTMARFDASYQGQFRHVGPV